MSNDEFRHSTFGIGHSTFGAKLAAIYFAYRIDVYHRRGVLVTTASPAPAELRGMPAARYDLEDRLVRFGAEVCRLTAHLPATAVGKHVVIQIVRSGTSPLANYGEVQGAESRRDFIHKLGICVKELRETRAWLKLIAEMSLCPEEQLAPIIGECDELLAILASSIRTARQNGRNRM